MPATRTSVGDEHEADDEGRGVDQEHLGGAEDADQDPGERRARGSPSPGSPSGARRSPRPAAPRPRRRGRAGARLGREGRRGEDADREDEHEQERERERVGDVQERDRGHQRRAHAVADQHRPPGAEPVASPPARPPSATAAVSTASTIVIRVGEPEVVSTNHGSATHVICDPVSETISRASSPISPRLRGEVAPAHDRRGLRLRGPSRRNMGLKTPALVTAR